MKGPAIYDATRREKEGERKATPDAKSHALLSVPMPSLASLAALRTPARFLLATRPALAKIGGKKE